MPLALAATQKVPAQTLAVHADQQAGTWTFHHEHVLGTSLALKIRAASFPAAQRAEAAALTEIDRQDRILSGWRHDSEFSRWARTQLLPIQVSPELYEVLAACDHWRDQTDGALDPSAEAAARLWRNAAAENRTPTQAEIAQTVEAMQQPHWRLDPTHATATRLTHVPLALASFAKSHITSRPGSATKNKSSTTSKSPKRSSTIPNTAPSPPKPNTSPTNAPSPSPVDSSRKSKRKKTPPEKPPRLTSSPTSPSSRPAKPRMPHPWRHHRERWGYSLLPANPNLTPGR